MAANEDAEDSALKARLDALSAELDGQRRGTAATPDPVDQATSVGSAMNLGFRVLTEFVAAVVVGALIGWQIDVWAKTSPVFLIVFLAFGTAAGFWTVYRIAVRPTGRTPDQKT